jgi:hypothetical protein
MKLHLSIAVAVLLVAVSTISGHAEDSAVPARSQPATAQPDTPAASVPRPSIIPKAAEPPPPPLADTAPESRVSHRHYPRYAYRAQYFGPIPIYWPEFGRNRIRWHRIFFPWPFRFG